MLSFFVVVHANNNYVNHYNAEQLFHTDREAFADALDRMITRERVSVLLRALAAIEAKKDAAAAAAAAANAATQRAVTAANTTTERANNAASAGNAPGEARDSDDDGKRDFSVNMLNPY